MKFDEILEHIGEFGPYQKRVFYLLALPTIICGYQVFSVIFVYDIPAYRCAIPDYPNDSFKIQNEAHAQLINYTIPSADDDDDEGSVYSMCKIYDEDLTTTNTSRMLESTLYTYGSNTTRTKRECSKRVYDKKDIESTIISEFDLVCGEEIMRSHANSLQFFGSFVGSLGMGVIADVFGRKKAIMISLILHIGVGFTIYFAKSFYVIMGVRLLGGISSHALFAIPATTGIELVGRSKRSFTGTTIEFFWAVGVMLVLPVTYLTRQWRDIQLFITVLSLPLLGLWWLIPESPRWLLDKKRLTEVEVILQRICKSNKTNLPSGALNPEKNEDGPQIRIWAMFTNRVLIIRTFIIFFNWYAVNLFYYGLSLNTSNIEGNPYLNYLYTSLVETVAYVSCIFAVPWIGRRKLHFSLMMTGGLALLSVIPVVLTDGPAWTIVVLAQIGKFCASFCYTVLYIMSAELFPTVLRNSGIGFCSIFESLGGMTSPYIADLGLLVEGPLGKSLSLVVFGAVSTTAAVISLFLPETLHRRMPETIQDAIDFDKQEMVRPNRKSYELAPLS